MRTKMTAALRRLLDRKKLIVVPGCYDAHTAKIIEKVGFKAVYMSGGGTAASFGLQDVGFQSLTEVVGNIHHITDTVRIPVIADADTGFGNAVHVTRAVKEYIHAGAAAMHIEDQVFYKRCGHLAGKMLISSEEAVGKYRAADDTRKEYDEDFVIIARTDSRGAVGGGVKEAIKRSNAYVDAGADLIFVEAPASEEEVEIFAREVKAPLLYNWAGISPKLSIERLQELGIAIVIFPGLSTRATTKSVWDLAYALMSKGTAAMVEFEQQFKRHPLRDRHAFMGIPEIIKLEEKYLPKKEIQLRREKSLTGYKY